MACALIKISVFLLFPFLFLLVNDAPELFFFVAAADTERRPPFHIYAGIIIGCFMCYFGRKSKRNGSLLFSLEKQGANEACQPASTNGTTTEKVLIDRFLGRPHTSGRRAHIHYSVSAPGPYTAILFFFSFLSASFRSLSYWQLLHINIHWTVLLLLLQCAH